jgi:hypothetical protein
MDDYYAWLLKTSRGDFYVSVCGEWTEEEAVTKLLHVMITIGLVFTAMVPRKRIPGSPDNTGTIFQNEKSKTGLGFDFYAGKKFWEVAGRGTEYAAEMILFGKQLERESD